MSLLILFLFSMASETPFCSFREFSRYYFELIEFPSMSINCRAKSLRTQRKEGKYSAISSSWMLWPFLT
jgi:hypothetical protein